MDKFVIKGPSKIKGDIRISGSKNAALPILAATLLFSKPVELKNVPNVRDIQTMLNLLRYFKKKIRSLGFLVRGKPSWSKNSFINFSNPLIAIL